jgi:hypothetical protein
MVRIEVQNCVTVGRTGGTVSANNPRVDMVAE